MHCFAEFATGCEVRASWLGKTQEKASRPVQVTEIRSSSKVLMRIGVHAAPMGLGIRVFYGQ